MSSETTKASRLYAIAAVANAIELGAAIVERVSGDDVADGFGGEELKRDDLQQLLGAKISGYLANPKLEGMSS